MDIPIYWHTATVNTKIKQVDWQPEDIWKGTQVTHMRRWPVDSASSTTYSWRHCLYWGPGRRIKACVKMVYIESLILESVANLLNYQVKDKHMWFKKQKTTLTLINKYRSNRHQGNFVFKLQWWLFCWWRRLLFLKLMTDCYLNIYWYLQ